MSKKAKIVLSISLPVISSLIVMLLIFSFLGTNRIKAKYDFLVRDHLQTMASVDSTFDVHNVIIYWTDDGRAYVYIDYYVDYDGMTDESFFAVDCTTTLVLRHGLENLQPEKFQDFYDVRDNSNEPVVYTTEEISSIMASS